MAAVRVLLGVVCLFVIGSSWGADRNFIAHGAAYKKQNHGRIGDFDSGRKKICAIAQAEIGVQEDSENSSARIDGYNAYVGFKKVAWCASFVSWCHGQAGYPQPRSAWSPALFPADRLTKNPIVGTVMGIYFNHLKRIGHCGIIYKIKGELVFCVEGNTNVNGGREGTGVYSRVRHVRSIYRFADWWTN